MRMLVLATTLALIAPSTGRTQEKPSPSTPSDLAFLEVGKTYVIRFPAGVNPLRLDESGLVAQPSGPPANWTSSFEINTFVVRKLGGGSWVLLEHPVDVKEGSEVQLAQLQLADKEWVAKLEADPAKREFLAQRRATAGVKVKTTRTWLNLAHATSIADPLPPGQKFEVKVDIKVK